MCDCAFFFSWRELRRTFWIQECRNTEISFLQKYKKAHKEWKEEISKKNLKGSIAIKPKRMVTT